ncbi:SMP-30/gluconolactonase/LRE family protein [Ktedonosporobacter rubrisoli]|uniref:SMP-30/gluconolactonase/LRE family protein n=1 Tax=Ktedonosporobacter rubrisoli TaxID=2509675 RepID=A0A4P6JI90_KTERU|nr:SMP-30/gluconolactonase/LRE family protein [Ktedonosporobacter rubrisoli]QBD74777.1 SMP-30/gluconolactonase/LRE family protein [Ktedonosporobacter rubrisoli]
MSHEPKPQILLTNLSFGESPRWHAGKLWVSDWGTRELLTVSQDGKREVAVKLGFPSFQPICMDWLPDGRLLIVSSAEGRLLCRQADGSLTTYAELSQFSSQPWNEIVVDSRGNAYINGEVLLLITPDGTVRQVANNLAFPNGMAITPDNTTLILAESYARQLTAFDIASDGSLSQRRIWAELGDGTPDGICLDAEGAVWYADVPNKRCVRVREGGEVLQTITLDRGCFACMLGGDARKTLFLVTREWRGWEAEMQAASEKAADEIRTGQLLAVEVQVPGAGQP